MKIGEKIWHCKRVGIADNGVPIYAKPKEYELRLNYLSVNPAITYLDTIKYGEKVHDIYNMVANKNVFDKVFTEGDVLYIDGAEPPEKTDDNEYGDGANVLITAVMPILKCINIKLEKIQP